MSISSDFRNSIIRSIQHLNSEHFTNQLRDPDLDIIQMVDIGGYTLIHEIVLSNILQKMMVKYLKVILLIAKEKYGDSAKELLIPYANK